MVVITTNRRAPQGNNVPKELQKVEPQVPNLPQATFSTVFKVNPSQIYRLNTFNFIGVAKRWLDGGGCSQFGVYNLSLFEQLPNPLQLVLSMRLN